MGGKRAGYPVDWEVAQMLANAKGNPQLFYVQLFCKCDCQDNHIGINSSYGDLLHTIQRHMPCMDENMGICLLVVTRCQSSLVYHTGTSYVHISCAYLLPHRKFQGIECLLRDAGIIPSCYHSASEMTSSLKELLHCRTQVCGFLCLWPHECLA